MESDINATLKRHRAACTSWRRPL